MQDIELLAPVGSWEALEAAVQNGADAVYLGGKAFSARQHAQNFDEEELKKAVGYCHIRGVKVFVTVNTLASNEELGELTAYLTFLYKIDIDAIIVQDLGVAKLVKELLPDFELHASTQMFIHNLDGVKLLEEKGFQRVVLAREMSKEEIAWIQKNTKLDIEVFVHGALCIGYSGQCLMSSMIGGRSGNRGRCAQPCRKDYALVDMHSGKEMHNPLGTYLLSPKDLNTLENIHEILDTGIKSLKIEGRMKRPEYVATVVKAYRNAIDQYKQHGLKPQIDKAMQKEVEQVFNRGFTRGYVLGEKGKDIMSFTKPSNRGIKIGKVIDYDKMKKRVVIQLEDSLSKGDGLEIWSDKGDNPGTIVGNLFVKGIKKDVAQAGDKIELQFKHVVAINSPVYKTSDVDLLTKAREGYEKSDKGIAIYGHFKGKLGQRIMLRLWDDKGNYVEQYTDYIVEKALKTPILKKRIKEQISKLGNTPYQLAQLEVALDEGIMIPIGELNQLRRNAIEDLNKIRENYNHRKEVSTKEICHQVQTFFHAKTVQEKSDINLRVSVHNVNQLKAVLGFDINRIYYSDLATLEEALKITQKQNIQLVPAFFRITEDNECIKIQERMQSLKNIKGIMVGNLGLLHALGNLNNTSIIADYSLNIFNNAAITFLDHVEEVTLSPELTLKQIRNILENTSVPCEVIVHGNLPLMVSKYCPTSAALSARGEKEHCSLCNTKQFGLKDRLGMIFPVVKRNHCKVEILNAQKLCMIEHMTELINANIKNIRIQFTIEDEVEIKETLNAYLEKIKSVLEGYPIQSQSTTDFITKMREQGLTKGHFYRGVM
ncbi:U32 family peptidase [Clostridiaceae bacterium 35-E11]